MIILILSPLHRQWQWRWQWRWWWWWGGGGGRCWESTKIIFISSPLHRQHAWVLAATQCCDRSFFIWTGSHHLRAILLLPTTLCIFIFNIIYIIHVIIYNVLYYYLNRKPYFCCPPQYINIYIRHILQDFHAIPTLDHSTSVQTPEHTD